MRFRITMTGAVRGKTMPLDDTAVTFADRSARDIHLLPDLKYVQTYDRPRRKVIQRSLALRGTP